MVRATPGGGPRCAWLQGGAYGIFKRAFRFVQPGPCHSQAAPSWSAAKIRMEVQGTTLRLYVDGVLWLSGTDTSIATGQPGILGNGPGVLDNFRAGDLPYTPAVVPTSDTFTYADGPLATVGATNWQDTALGPGSGEGMLYPANVFNNRVRNLNPTGPSYGNNAELGVWKYPVTGKQEVYFDVAQHDQ